jgi:hypothetical protein
MGTYIVITEPFDFMLEINNKRVGSHTVEVVSSTMPWDSLQHKIAEHLNIYPASLHAQYHLSTDNKQLLPCDLTSQCQLDVMKTLL